MASSGLTGLNEGLITGLAVASAIIASLFTLLLVRILEQRKKARQHIHDEREWATHARHSIQDLGVRSPLTSNASFRSPIARIDSGRWSAEQAFVPYDLPDVHEHDFFFRLEGSLEQADGTMARASTRRSRSATVSTPDEISRTTVNNIAPRARSLTCTFGSIGPAPTCPLPPLPYHVTADRDLSKGEKVKIDGLYTSKAAQIVLQVLGDENPKPVVSSESSSQRSSSICPLDAGSPVISQRVKGHRRKGYVRIPHLRLDNIRRFTPQSYLHPNDSKLSLSSASLDTGISNDPSDLINIPNLPYLDDLFSPSSEVTTPTFRITRPSGEMERRTSFPFLSETPSSSMSGESDGFPWAMVVDQVNSSELSGCSTPCSEGDFTACSDPLDFGIDISPRTKAFPRKADIVAALNKETKGMVCSTELPLSPESRSHSPLGSHPPARPRPASPWSSEGIGTPDVSSPAPRRVLGELTNLPTEAVRPCIFRCHTGDHFGVREDIGLRLPALHVESYDARALRENVFAINAGLFEDTTLGAEGVDIKTPRAGATKTVERPKTSHGNIHEQMPWMAGAWPRTPRRNVKGCMMSEIESDSRSPLPSAEELFFTPGSLYDAKGFLR